MTKINVVTQSGHAWIEECESVADAFPKISEIVDAHGVIERVELLDESDSVVTNLWTMARGNALLHDFATACAEAYVAQYVDPDGRRVMNHPVVYYDPDKGTFWSCSNLTPLADDEILVEELEAGIYGDDTGTPEEVTDAIIDYLMHYDSASTLDALLEKIF